MAHAASSADDAVGGAAGAASLADKIKAFSGPLGSGDLSELDGGATYAEVVGAGASSAANSRELWAAREQGSPVKGAAFTNGAGGADLREPAWRPMSNEEPVRVERPGAVVDDDDDYDDDNGEDDDNDDGDDDGEDDDNDDDDDDDGDEDSSDNTSEGLVEQKDSFSKLSADSWVHVESEYGEEDEEHEGVDHAGRSSTAELEEMPDFSETLLTRAVKDITACEVLVALLPGTGATKKKRFRAGGDRRVWFSSDLKAINWTSTKKTVDHETLALTKIRKVGLAGKDISIETVERRKVLLSLPSQSAAAFWVRCLACYAPRDVDISAPDLEESERLNYDIKGDTWKGTAVRSLRHINEYACFGSPTPNAKVDLVYHKEEAMFYALRFVSFQEKTAYLGSPEEMTVLQKLDHPGILKYKEFLYSTEPNGFHLIFEYAPRGTITDSRSLRGAHPIPEESVRHLARDLFDALAYLHSIKIAHNNIRPENILYSVEGKLKLNPLGCVPFEFTKRNNPRGRTLGGRSSVAFLAPEQCNSQYAPKLLPESFGVDVWSAAVMVFFMAFGRAPFLGDSPSDIQDSICTSKLEFPSTPQVSKKFRDFLRKILSCKEPDTRPSVFEVLKHPFLSEGVRARLRGKKELGKARLSITPQEVEDCVGVAVVTEPK